MEGREYKPKGVRGDRVLLPEVLWSSIKSKCGAIKSVRVEAVVYYCDEYNLGADNPDKVGEFLKSEVDVTGSTAYSHLDEEWHTEDTSGDLDTIRLVVECRNGKTLLVVLDREDIGLCHILRLREGKIRTWGDCIGYLLAEGKVRVEEARVGLSQ